MQPDFDHRICVNDYGFYCVPEAYRGREIPTILAAGGVYEPGTLALMRRWARAGDIVTGGAFIGDFFPALTEALAPGCRVHSFEPNPLSHAAASATIALNGLTSVTVAPVAVGAEPGVLPLQLTRPGGSTAAARARLVAEPGQGETIDVPVTTLDALVPPDRIISILHLDIEGHEAPALRGATRILNDQAPMVVLEAPRRRHRQAFEQLLRQLAPTRGYRLCGSLERNAVYRALG